MLRTDLEREGEEEEEDEEGEAGRLWWREVCDWCSFCLERCMTCTEPLAKGSSSMGCWAKGCCVYV